MPATRRPIVRWTVIAIVAPVLLLASYVSAWLAFPQVAGSDVIPMTVVDAIDPLFAPIDAYCASDLPGAESLDELWMELNGMNWTCGLELPQDE